MTTLYLSGPMTGYPGYNFPAFREAAGKLRAHGYAVLDPSEHGDTGRTWAEYLRLDIADVLRADGLAVLPDWQCSRGSALEVHVAHALALPVMPVERWLEALS
jgi:hypothetical protein